MCDPKWAFNSQALALRLEGVLINIVLGEGGLYMYVFITPLPWLLWCVLVVRA